MFEFDEFLKTLQAKKMFGSIASKIAEIIKSDRPDDIKFKNISEIDSIKKLPLYYKEVIKTFLSKQDSHLLSTLLLDNSCENIKLFEGIGKTFKCYVSASVSNIDEIKESVMDSLKSEKYYQKFIRNLLDTNSLDDLDVFELCDIFKGKC